MKVFFNSLKVNETLAPCIEGLRNKDNTSIEMKNEIVEYRHFLDHAIKSRVEMEKKGKALAPITFEKQNSRKSKFSTLFCPTSFEFFDPSDDGNKGSLKGFSGDVNNGLETEYIQFYIPKRQITGVFREKTTNDFILSSNADEINGADDSTILEVWCKVFQVRELASNI